MKKVSKKRKTTQKATVKKAYFSKFGFEAVPKLAKKDGSKYLRTNLEELAEIILPEEVTSSPLTIQDCIDQGFALAKTRDPLLNKPAPEVKLYLKSLFDEGKCKNTVKISSQSVH